jgi:hypothetical protein
MKEVFCESGIYGREKEPLAAFVTNVFEQKSKMRKKIIQKMGISDKSSAHSDS